MPAALDERAQNFYTLRVRCAAEQKAARTTSDGNGDEALYADRNDIGNFTKGLSHGPQTGLVDPQAYRSILRVLETGQIKALDARATKSLTRVVGSALDDDSAIACNAMEIINGFGPKATAESFDMDTFRELIGLAVDVSGNAMFYQKMYVQRRARPEQLGALVHPGPKAAPLHHDVWNSPAPDMVRARYGTALLPQAYLEGCPTHPSYPAGHATLAGAGATMVKALSNESFVIEKAMIPAAHGSALRTYPGPALTLGGELDKTRGELRVRSRYGRRPLPRR